MTHPKLRIGIGQIEAEAADVEGNLDRIAAMADRAESAGVGHLVLPELALTGYLTDRRFASASVRLDGAPMDRLRELSRRVAITTGFIEETPASIFHNSAVHLEDGRVRHRHRKIYLPTYGIFDERRYYGPGWEVAAFDTAAGRMAILICGDAWHLPLAYLAANDGADVLLILAASSNEGLTETTPCSRAWHWMCCSYALTLSCFVVFANLAGSADGHTFWGGSFVAGPDGNVIAESETSREDLVVADLDFATLREQRIRLPFRRDDSIAHTIALAQRIHRARLRRERFEDVTGIDPLPVPARPG